MKKLLSILILVAALAILAPSLAFAQAVGGGASGGSGDVTASSNFGTDNAVVRADGTGKGVQSSGVTIDDSGNISTPGSGNFTGSGPFVIAPFKTEASISNPAAFHKSLFFNDDDGDRLSAKDSSGAVENYVAEAATQTLTNKTIDGESNTLQHRRATDCSTETGGVVSEMCVDSDDGSAYICIPSAGDCDTSGEWIALGGGGGATVVWDEIVVGFSTDVAGSTDNTTSAGCGDLSGGGTGLAIESPNALNSITNIWETTSASVLGTDVLSCMIFLGENIDTATDPKVAFMIHRTTDPSSETFQMNARVACHEADVTVGAQAGARLDAEIASAAWSEVGCTLADSGGSPAWSLCEITIATPHQYGENRMCRFDISRDGVNAADSGLIADIGTPLAFKFSRTLGP